jgi:hypothetical protein
MLAKGTSFGQEDETWSTIKPELLPDIHCIAMKWKLLDYGVPTLFRIHTFL